METSTSQRHLGRMTPRESIYLNFLRAFSSLAVVIDHAPPLFDMPDAPRWGHQAVMVFFVLSGYVISSVAETRETTARAFITARLARLWSVLFPAVLLTIVCDAVGREFGHNPAAYALAPVDHPLIRLGAVLGFLSETWVSIQPFSNGVVWSLCAEFWYYALFAACIFTPPGRVRAATVGVAVLLSGHKALLLLPVWLMGAALQRSHALRRLGLGASAALYIVSSVAIGWVLATHAYDPAIGLMSRFASPWVMTHLAQARVFWFDWFFGLAVAAHILGARALADRLPLERVAAPIRWCAGASFAAYLFHAPLLHLCAAFLPANEGWLAVTLTLAVIAVIGPPVERSKLWWRREINRVPALIKPASAVAGAG